MDRTCEYCRGPFRAKPAQVAIGRGRFCRKECADAARRIYGTDRAARCTAAGCVNRVKGKGRRFCSYRCSAGQRRATVECTCVRCGRTFERWRSRAAQGGETYCGQACRDYRERRECAVCGNAFLVSRPRLKKGGGIYCSTACQDRRWGARAERACPQCGRSFSVSPSREGKKYCTQACYFAARDVPRLRMACKQCGRVRPRYPSVVARGEGKFCNQRCYDRYRAPKRFRCRGCRGWFTARAWEKRQFCGTACAYRGRGHARDPKMIERNRRILALRSEGLKAPVILARLSTEKREWGSYSVATIRQVISRELRPALAR